MNNNQYNPNEQYQQNNQYNPNQQYQQNYNQYQNPNGNGGDFMDKIKNFILNTPVEKEPIDPQDIQTNNMLSLVAYIGLLFWIPLVAASKSKFARFHANQGLVLCLFSIVLSVASSIVYAILDLIPFVGAILILILSIAIFVVEVGYMALGIYNCVKGRANELPLIGKFRIIQTSPQSTVNYNNVNNNYNNYNTPNNYNNLPNNANTNYNSTTPNTAYDNTKQDTGFDANAYSSGEQAVDFGNNTNEQSDKAPSLSLDKNDSSNS